MSKTGLAGAAYDQIRARILALIPPGAEMQTLDIFNAVDASENAVRSSLIYMVRAGDLVITDHWTYFRPKPVGARVYDTKNEALDDFLATFDWGDQDETWWGF